MFSQITYPDNDVKFLYERSAKMSDSVFYQNNSPDTNNLNTWNLLYEEMYLENWTLNRTATFSAQYNLFVNERNPYYEYSNTSSNPLLNLTGVYSKQASFLIDQNGDALFKHSTMNNPTNLGLVYNNDMSPNWDKLEKIIPICTESYDVEGEFMVYYPNNQTNEEIRVHLYPNPNNGDQVMLEYGCPRNIYYNLVNDDVAFVS